jgi:hypothetical protein
VIAVVGFAACAVHGLSLEAAAGPTVEVRADVPIGLFDGSSLQPYGAAALTVATSIELF